PPLTSTPSLHAALPIFVELGIQAIAATIRHPRAGIAVVGLEVILIPEILAILGAVIIQHAPVARWEGAIEVFTQEGNRVIYRVGDRKSTRLNSSHVKIS